jgi:hypothetical protein
LKIRDSFNDDSPLALLLGAYFHQDWFIEGANTQEVLDRFVAEADTEVIRGAKHQAEALLAAGPSERRLARTLNGMGLYYLPGADGLTYREWLAWVAEALGGALRR